MYSEPPINRARKYRGVIALLVGAVVLIAIGINNGTVPRDTLLIIAVLVPSIILHEVSHGAVALLFGDETAKHAGRLTLNPVPHIDPLGTIILPALLAMSNAPAFGYAKPVPVDPSRLRNPRDHMVLVALAGPAVNIGLALIAAAALRAFTWSGSALDFWIVLGYANVVLATFNLIPIPPLDGSSVLERFLPRSFWPTYVKFRRFSIFLLLILVFAGGGLLNDIFEPPIQLWASLAHLP